ncbi:MAG TPA: parvulin peptidyl-prolyl isomerase [Caldithrix abyssi]|uniref:Parvulin peptidyl-prolyl isomerase n=1 Tax=Caldithrix abyssi TaxID=187145 RepID=A0A7V5H204_CALAY|nr:parvulin peptidyl-prolyl isomerase [Caldithrix abyssi]
MKKVHFIILMLIVGISNIFAQQLVESIAAIVDKEIILRSEVEQFTQNYILQNRLKIRPGSEEYNQLRKKMLEGLIEQKLLLAKAEADTVKVDDQMLDQRVEERIKYMVEQVGSQDKLEEIFGSSISQIRKDTRKLIKEQMLVEQVRAMRFRDVKVSRREVEEFYKMYKDSLPTRPATVDISHILKVIKPSEEAQLKAYRKAEMVLQKLKDGEDFAKLAKLYSEDPASAKRGGDLGFTQRGDLVPEYEAVAFNLKDGEISDIVQTQFGFHIIQLIERRGERIHTRHILIQVKPTEEDEKRIVEQLKEIRQKILDGADFSEMALKYSDDENVTKDKGHLGVFELDKLQIPQFRQVLANMKPGEISEPFKTDYGYHIVKLNAREEAHKLTLENDWEQIEQMALNFKMQKEYQKWLAQLRKEIFVKINES